MLDENLIATLEQSLRQTRNAQSRLMARLREVEFESERLREEIDALENSAAQTESAIDSLLVQCVQVPGSRAAKPPGRSTSSTSLWKLLPQQVSPIANTLDHGVLIPLPLSQLFFAESRSALRTTNIEPISYRPRTITQACTLLSAKQEALHVNGFTTFRFPAECSSEQPPTISIAV
jgi:hypothetical protein